MPENGPADHNVEYNLYKLKLQKGRIVAVISEMKQLGVSKTVNYAVISGEVMPLR